MVDHVFIASKYVISQVFFNGNIYEIPLYCHAYSKYW